MDIRAEDHKSDMAVSIDWATVPYVEQFLRSLTPPRRNHLLRQIANQHAMICIEIYAYLLLRLSDTCCTVICVVWISSATGECNMASPPISSSRSALYEKDFRFPVLNPRLWKEILEALKARASRCTATAWVVDGSVRNWGPETYNERDRGSLLAGRGIGNVRVMVGLEES